MSSLLSTHSQAFVLLLSLGLGTLMGLRRELDAQSQKEKDRSFMGVRTAILFTVLGALSTFFPDTPTFPLFVFSGALILLAVAYANGAFFKKRIGLTSELSALAMVFVGILLGQEQFIPAIFLTIIIIMLKEFRLEVHKFIAKLSVSETRGALQLLIFSGAVLPFLPTDPIDPWGIFVPFNIWLLVVFISGINFVGYFLIKALGEKAGTFITAILGALVSSTAVTISLATQSKQKNFSQNLIVASIIAAIAVMDIRVMIEILVAGTAESKGPILFILGIMGVVGFLYAFGALRSVDPKKGSKATVKIKSPFELLPAIKFGIIFVLILSAIAIGKRFLGNTGVFMAAGLSGIVDIDAVVLSSLEAVRNGELSAHTAETAIFIGAIVNTLVKLVYVGILGNRKILKKLSIGMGILAFTGLLTWFFIA